MNFIFTDDFWLLTSKVPIILKAKIMQIGQLKGTAVWFWLFF